MEHKPAENREDSTRERLFPKSSLIIIAVFLVVQMAVLTLLFWSRMFGGGGALDVDARSDLQKTSLVTLGRLEITKSNDPLQQSFTYVSVMVDLDVPSSRAQEMEANVSRLGSIFKEHARKAFLDADARDLATENVASVKNSIKNRINQTLGEEIVRNVVFPDYRVH